MSNIKYDIDDLRWFELFDKVEKLTESQNNPRHYVINHEVNDFFTMHVDDCHYINVYFYNYRKAICSIVKSSTTESGYGYVHYATIGELFERLSIEYKEIFVFYLDLFNETDYLNVAKQYE
jgi:hypothetical protein